MFSINSFEETLETLSEYNYRSLSISFLDRIGYYQRSAKLIKAVKDNDSSAFDAELSRWNVNMPNRSGYTALHWAIKLDRIEMAQKLIKQEANVNQETYYQITPLYLAIEDSSTYIWKVGHEDAQWMPDRRNKLKLIKLLAENGAELKKYPSIHNGPNTPLEHVVRQSVVDKSQDTIETIKYLTSQGVDLNYVPTDVELPSKSALHIACYKENYELVEYLINHGALINRICFNRTPLDEALYGIDLKARTNKGNCNYQQYLKIIELLISKDASLPASRAEALKDPFWYDPFSYLNSKIYIQSDIKKELSRLKDWAALRLLWVARKKEPGSLFAMLPIELVKEIISYVRG